VYALAVRDGTVLGAQMRAQHVNACPAVVGDLLLLGDALFPQRL
jgi:hypothetical protein